jgi:integrase
MATLLSDKQVKSLTEPGRYPVAPLLFLVIAPTGSKTFHARVTLENGKRSWRSLGRLEDLTVKEARTKVLEITKEKSERVVTTRTFAVVFEEFMRTNEKHNRWKNDGQTQWHQSFRDYIKPKIGGLKVDEIKPFHVVEVLKPIWSTKMETARRVQGRIKTVIDYELARLGLMAINPAETRFISNLLPKQKLIETHLSAPTFIELKQLYQSLDIKFTSHYALKWLILHGCRTTEAKEATHSEIKGNDKDGYIWVIPPERMKNNLEHTSPVMMEIPKRVGESDLLFPKDGKPLSINGMRSILQKRKITWTVHGIRATFSTWCQENGISDSFAERQLSHKETNSVRRAYARSDLLQERKVVLTKWKDALDAK